MDATASGPQCCPTVTDRKDGPPGDEPQSRGTISQRKEMPTRQTWSLLVKARKPQCHAETREALLGDLCVFSGQSRILIYSSYYITNPAMSHVMAVDIDPVSRQAISQPMGSARTTDGETLAG